MRALLKALFIKGLVQFGISAGLKSKAPKYILLKIIAGCLFLVASIFALIAGHEVLSAYYESPMVNLIFAAGFALVAIMILIVVAAKRKQHESKSPLDAPLRTLEHLGDRAQVQAKYLGEKAETVIRRKPSKAMIGVAFVSLIMGWRAARKR